MSSSAVGVFLVYLLGLVLGFLYQPMFALFSYLWIFYNDPSTHWWGKDLPDLRYSLFAAFVALVVSFRQKGNPGAPWIKTPAAKLLLAYAIWTWIQTFWAIKVPIHTEGAVLFTKFAILSYVIYRIAADEKNIGLFLWAHIIGCFLFGWEAYTSNVRGRLETIGGPGVDDANLLAAHMITGLVTAGFLFLGQRGWRRWIAFATLPFILNAIILTQSRGGFLALLGGGAAAWYFAPKVHRRLVGVGILVAGVMMMALANQQFWERISTLSADKNDASQETRAKLIGPQFRMFLDHPLGAGHRGNEFLSPQYMTPDLLSNSGRRAAHNTFMAALVDQGFPGALILVSLYGWGFVTLLRLKRLDALGLPPALGVYRGAIGAALVSCFVSGMFLNLLKTEVQIWFIVLLASLAGVCKAAVPEKALIGQKMPRVLRTRARAGA